MKKRKYAQDFSEAKHGRITDSSFAPACDVNNIVRHYEKTGVDPYADRRGTALYEPASTMSFEDAMRNKAALDSAFEEQPAHVRAAHANSFAWLDHLSQPKPRQEAPNASVQTPEQPAPQDAAPDNSDGKVQ